MRESARRSWWTIRRSFTRFERKPPPRVDIATHRVHHRRRGIKKAPSLDVPSRRPDMKPRKCISLALTLCLLGTGHVCAQQPQFAGSAAPAGVEKLGKVNFPTSCDPKVQAEFERGVAMLHSYWFNYAGKTFRGILQQDPNCAMAYWGIAVD